MHPFTMRKENDSGFFRAAIFFAIVLFCASTGGVHAADGAVEDMQVEKPSSIGYRIGDIIPIKVSLELGDGWSIDHGTLPEVRRVNRWLELLSVDVTKSGLLQTKSAKLNFQYLIVGNPEKLSALVLPPLDFNLVNNGESWPVVVEPTGFTLSPILTHEARVPGQLPELSPPEPPQLIDADRRLRNMLIVALLFVAVMAYFLYLLYGREILQLYNKPFAKAVRELSALSRKEQSDSRYKDALKVVHTALQDTYGSVVMTEDLEAFFREFPRFSDCRTALQAVYDSSNAEFFDYGGTSSTRLKIEDDLLPLCRRCRRLERQL